jgi:diadenosine tetraphosphate (Ap4A) HIT family hydrolase
MACVFCKCLNENKLIAENDLAFAIYDNYPVNSGHVLVIPKRHFENFFDATPEETVALTSLIHDAKKILDIEYKPSGYNIGINAGADAGQTIFHLHIHLIPRYKGDVENPKGGIRNFKKPLVEY